MFKRKYLIVFFFSVFCFKYSLSANFLQQDADVNHIKQQIEDSKELAYEDFPGALKSLKLAYNSSITINDSLLTGEVLYAFGWIYYIKGKYDESLSHFLDALVIFRAIKKEVGIAKSLIGQGLVIQAIDRHKEALEVFDQVLNIYEKIESPELTGAVYINQEIKSHR